MKEIMLCIFYATTMAHCLIVLFLLIGCSIASVLMVKKRIITLQACSGSDASEVLCISKVVSTCCGISEER